ncbi:hypothetical protein [Streptosporangium sp. NPDC002524]|uniref:MmyB family transcriptional regulator n=1 Tax=Streptosporangium sp. NPDC002524 TaxID=3154537 RepID=UPI0033296A2B
MWPIRARFRPFPEPSAARAATRHGEAATRTARRSRRRWRDASGGGSFAGGPAAQARPRGRPATERVRPGLLLILDHLTETPARVVSDRGDVLAQNAMDKALHGDASARPGTEHNALWHYFTDPGARELFPAEDRDRAARAAVADLRATFARRPDDARLAGLVRRLRARSQEFSALWDAHHVAVRRTDVKRFLHPVAGLLELDCEVLPNPEHDQRLIVYTARPGSGSCERLRLLRVAGLQDPARGQVEGFV